MPQTKNFRRDYAYHAPLSDEDISTHERTRDYMLLIATQLEELIPDGREKSIMHTKLEEALFWANAAVARSRYDYKSHD